MICGMHAMASMQDLVRAVLVGAFFMLFSVWNAPNMFEVPGNKVQ